ncbi:MAG: MFS transporter [Gemmataceae bacterium]
MVPRPARDGDRPCDHGVRWRCDDRFAAVAPAHGALQGEDSTGVAETFTVLGVVYFLFMLFGVLTVRLPASGWKPAGFSRMSQRTITPQDRTAGEAIRTRAFWLLWGVLCLNVTAGIGVFAQASPMIQEMFPGKVTAAAAAGFVGLLSLFNMAGRLGWSSLSDHIGRKATYVLFLGVGAVLYGVTPETGRLGSVTLFVVCFAIIMSMYGGGFATIPAYLRDQFGTAQVGAIHGRLLTAWSLAGCGGAGAGELHPGVPDPARGAEGGSVHRDNAPDGGVACGGAGLQCARAVAARDCGRYPGRAYSRGCNFVTRLRERGGPGGAAGPVAVGGRAAGLGGREDRGEIAAALRGVIPGSSLRNAATRVEAGAPEQPRLQA